MVSSLPADGQYSSLKHVGVFSLTVTHWEQDLEEGCLLEALLMHSILLVHFVFCLAVRRGTLF